MCLKNNIPSLYTVDSAGLYTKEIPYFTNTHIFKADPIVIEKLKEQNKLLKNGKLRHSYPHSWRSKAPLIYRATPQWFISMEKNDLRKKAIKAINDTTFYPEKGKERLVEILLREENLNTYIVSHGWTHPVLAKIEVAKEEKVSRLELG